MPKVPPKAHSAQQNATAFAPPERDSREEVLAQYEAFLSLHCRGFFDALPSAILVLNKRRQAVFANRAAVEFLGQTCLDSMLGQRPGEALGCMNANEGAGGCGTSRHCRNCGAVQAILSAVDGDAAAADCALLRRGQQFLEGLELHVTATPLTVGGADYVIFSCTDISHELRRRSMERIFFHDVLNLAGGISGLVELMRGACAQEQSGEFSVLHSATQTLVDEIVAQRELLAAEANEITPLFAPAETCELLGRLSALYSSLPLAVGQAVVVDPGCVPVRILTDVRLAQRVLGNMIKNALEAGGPGDTVRLSCRDEGHWVRLCVHNAAAIPPGLQDDIFRRRVSTKGEARGLGTYSMLLLSERCLGGSVGFSSSPEAGTTFHLLLPKRPEKA